MSESLESGEYLQIMLQEVYPDSLVVSQKRGRDKVKIMEISST